VSPLRRSRVALVGVGPEPRADDRIAGARNQVMTIAGPAVISMTVSDDRLLDGPPRVDMKVAGGTIEAVVGGEEERVGHEFILDPSAAACGLAVRTAKPHATQLVGPAINVTGLPLICRADRSSNPLGRAVY
jgi:hypothetical protein